MQEKYSIRSLILASKAHLYSTVDFYLTLISIIFLIFVRVMKKIYVLDGSGFLYRAWHAFRSMSNTQNDTVTMVYGFFRMIIKLLMEKPDNLIIVWDAHGKTVRHEKFE